MKGGAAARAWVQVLDLNVAEHVLLLHGAQRLKPVLEYVGGRGHG
jgi:hypothetical protein